MCFECGGGVTHDARFLSFIHEAKHTVKIAKLVIFFFLFTVCFGCGFLHMNAEVYVLTFLKRGGLIVAVVVGGCSELRIIVTVQ